MVDQKNQRIKNEYNFNRKFKDYVDQFCKRHEMDIEEAFSQPVVLRAALFYSEV